MITVVHGSNQVLTRNSLNSFRQKYQEVLILNGKNLTKNDLELGLKSQSLFGQDKLLIIENYFQGKKNREEVVKYLNSLPETQEIVFWEDRESKIADLKKLNPKNSRILQFNFPTVIFKFLDSLYPGNHKVSYVLFESCLEQNEAEMIFFMTVKLFRNLLLTKNVNDKKEQNFPDDYLKISSWQKQKLFVQAKLFETKDLILLYNKLLNLDYEIKTGESGIDMETGLKLFILQSRIL
ncbi:MAG: hypothetical protein M1120_03585 [Patescibacteria group bacterium]|nr:hypothetical protein [Patescibacteria group bacterium]